MGPRYDEARSGEGQAGQKAEAKSVHEVTYDLLRYAGADDGIRKPRLHRADVPEELPRRLHLRPGIARGLGVGHGRRVRPVHRQARLGQRAHRAGTGNAMGSLVAAYKGNVPLIVTAGQQTREMVLCEPYLANKDETLFPQPWVKWAYEPKRAEDVPAAFMRAYAVALQPPAGPVFLSIPLDDWEKPALGPAVVRTVSHRVSPDAQRLRGFAERINRAQRPLLVFGPEVDRSGAWDAGVAFAEKVGAPVYSCPLPDRASFPEDHRLFQGQLPMTDRRCQRGADRSRPCRGDRGAGLPLLPIRGGRVPARGHRTAADHRTIRAWRVRRRSGTACSGTPCWRWSSWWTWSTITATGRSRPTRRPPPRST